MNVSFIEARKAVVAVIAMAMSAILALFLAGCQDQAQSGPSTTSGDNITINASPIEIVDQGYAIGSTGEVDYAFIVNNPNKGYIADDVMFTISGYDGEGAMVLANVATASSLLPGARTAVVGSSYLANNADSIEQFDIRVSMETVQWKETSIEASSLDNMFQIAGARNGRGNDNSVNVSGRVVALNAGELANIEGVGEESLSVDVTAVFIDSEGNPIAGSTVNGVKLNELEGVAKGEGADGNDSPDSASGNAEDGTDGALRSGQFEVSLANAPAYKEIRYFVMPVIP